VARFLVDLEPGCFDLADSLRQGVWRPGPYRAFWIRDPKRRLISAAPFRDRVVHHGLVSLMEPLFERRFVAHSYACRKGKGTHRALARAFRLARRFPYVLKGDLVKYFPSLDHAVVKRAIRRVVNDRRFLDVLDLVIDRSNPQEPVIAYFPGDDLFTPLERRKGLPIGNLTSQFLANVVLDRLDHFIMDDRGFGCYVRYCDDFLVFGRDRRSLWALRSDVQRVLHDLRLKLHPGKGGVIGTRSPIPFLGFVLHGGKLKLQRKAVVRATRRLRRAERKRRAGVAGAADVGRSLQAWIAHASQGHTRGIRARMLELAGLLAAESEACVV
jgi:hypothetical protein